MHVSRRLTIVIASAAFLFLYVMTAIWAERAFAMPGAQIWPIWLLGFPVFGAGIALVLVGWAVIGLVCLASWLATGNLKAATQFSEKIAVAWIDWWVWQPPPKPVYEPDREEQEALDELNAEFPGMKEGW